MSRFVSSLIIVLLLSITSTAAQSQIPPPLPIVDESRLLPDGGPFPGLFLRDQLAAFDSISRKVDDAVIEWNPATGTAARVVSPRGFLSGPTELGPAAIVRRFLAAHANLFQLVPEDFPSINVVEISRTKGGAPGQGAIHVVLGQQWNGLQVFPASVVATMDVRGRLVCFCGTLLPRVADVLGPAEPAVSVEEALEAAARTLGAPAGLEGVTALTDPIGPERRQVFSGGTTFQSDVRVRLMYFISGPRDGVQYASLVWEVLAAPIGSPYRYRTLVEADRVGIVPRVPYRVPTTALAASELTAYFLKDSAGETTPQLSPLPGVPNWGANSPVHPIVIDGQDSWVIAGGATTAGNNARAFDDANGDAVPSPTELGQGVLVDNGGSQTAAFHATVDFSTSPKTPQNVMAALFHLFATTNWWHDRMEALGFTEAAGNFQEVNYSGQGQGGDPVYARLLHYGIQDYAFFHVELDGNCCPRMDLAIYIDGIREIEAALDATVIIHELTHGLTYSLVGGPSVPGLDQGPVSTGLWEGYSDVFAALLLSLPISSADESGEANFVVGAYANSILEGINGYSSNQFGFRRFPYSTNLCNNPLTIENFLDEFPKAALGNCLADAPQNPFYGNSMIYKIGEFWTSLLWDVRSRLLAKHGFVGNEMLLRLIMTSLRCLKPQPTMEEARDAILLADRLLFNEQNRCELWAGFSRRGLGPTASGAGTGVHVADYAPPSDCSQPARKGLFPA